MREFLDFRKLLQKMWYRQMRKMFSCDIYSPYLWRHFKISSRIAHKYLRYHIFITWGFRWYGFIWRKFSAFFGLIEVGFLMFVGASKIWAFFLVFRLKYFSLKFKVWSLPTIQHHVNYFNKISQKALKSTP